MIMYPNTFSGDPAVQVESELRDFIDLLQAEGVKSYLEIGSARGDTFHEVMTHLPKWSKGTAVDLPQSVWGLKNSKKQLGRAVAHLNTASYGATAIYGSSRDPYIRARAHALGPYDCVMIDGDHTMDGVTQDWFNYGDMGRIIAFHDIVDTMNPNKKGEKIEVPLFWNALKKKYRHVEFIGENSTMGIGVIFKD